MEVGQDRATMALAVSHAYNSDFAIDVAHCDLVHLLLAGHNIFGHGKDTLNLMAMKRSSFMKYEKVFVKLKDFYHISE